MVSFFIYIAATKKNSAEKRQFVPVCEEKVQNVPILRRFAKNRKEFRIKFEKSSLFSQKSLHSQSFQCYYCFNKFERKKAIGELMSVGALTNSA